MTVPFREWWKFKVNTLKWYSTTTFYPNDVSYWTTDHFDYGILGEYNNYAPYLGYGHRPILRPSESSFKSEDGMDEIIDFIFNVTIGESAANFDGYLKTEILDDPPYPIKRNDDTVCGKYYTDEIQWSAYPHALATKTTERPVIIRANLPEVIEVYGCSYDNLRGYECNSNKEQLFRNGLMSELLVSFGSGAIDYDCYLSFLPASLKLRYFNPVVNSLSIYKMATPGFALKIYGLGFKNSDTDLSPAENPYNDIPGGGWNDEVTHIDFIRISDGVTFTLVLADGDYTIDGAGEIISISAAIMAVKGPNTGTYNIRLRKENLNALIGSTPMGYAGDWVGDSDGRVRKGSRIVLLIGAFWEWKASISMACMDWKNKNKEIKKICYAPIDTRSRSVSTFYDGRILSCSPITRAIDDRTGLYSVSDMTIELANHDKEMSKMLTRYFLKNQTVEIFHAWCDEPEAWKRSVFQGIVVDYTLKGTSFFVTIKDVTQKYFKVKVPTEVCT